MLNINVITVGKLKESYLRDACAEYEKRLGAYSTIKVIELAESRLPDSPSQKEIANALENEADMILKKITPQSAVIAMCIEGKMMSSEDFSHKLEGFALEGKSTVNLIPFLNQQRAAHLRLSMSPMTFPHQLARVMLLEQLYRAMSISANGKYHK